MIDVGAAAPTAFGWSTATLGEIRDRAELVVLWRADPVVTHPRLLERLRLDPGAMIVVDSQRTATADAAGVFFEVDDDFEALWALRGGGGGLAERLRAARHVAFIHGALDELTALALHSLVRDLARDRHAVTLGLRAGNARGAEDVLDLADGVRRAGRLRARLPARSGARRVRRRARGGRRGGDRDGRLAGRLRHRGRRHRGGGHRPPHGRRADPAARTAATAIARASRTCWPPSRSASDAADRRRPRLRPRQRRRRRGARRLRAGRQDRRRRARPRPHDQRQRDGRHAGRGRHPRPHRRAEGQRRAQALARGASRRRRRAHRDHAVRHRRDRALDVHHRLPLRAARLHDRRRGRHAAARRPPHALGDPRHAGDRRRLPRPDGQQPAALRAHPHRAGPRPRGDRLVPAGDGRLRRQARQSRRRRDVEARQRQRDVARRRGPRGHAAAGDRDDRRRGARPRAAAPGARPLQQPRRVRATTARRSTRSTRSRAAARTSPTSSSTPTAASPAGGRARGRRSSPSTSARTRS